MNKPRTILRITTCSGDRFDVNGTDTEENTKIAAQVGRGEGLIPIAGGILISARNVESLQVMDNPH